MFSMIVFCIVIGITKLKCIIIYAIIFAEYCCLPQAFLTLTVFFMIFSALCFYILVYKMMLADARKASSICQLLE